MKPKILIADDEESIRYTFKSFLSEEGYDVITAKNHEEAMIRAREKDFDLIFLDIVLGKNNGMNLLKEIREINSRCPVVIITGYPNIETATEAVRLGAFDYLFKPVRQETILHTASLALRYKAVQDENARYRANLEAIFRSVKDAIITVDRDMNILELNDAATELCGFSRNSIRKNFDICRDLCNGKCISAITSTINTRKPSDLYRTECLHNDGRVTIVSINTSPLIDSNGDFMGAVLVVRDETRLDSLEQNLRERQQFMNIIGQSRSMQKIFSLINDLSDIETTVLITGESGTGKELIADAIHYSGIRSNMPLVKVNCSALSESLLESELFGHIKGAFTGADKDRTGRFEKAEGGTIFLDEIGDISPRVQLKLLRVLQEKEFERVGDSNPVKVNVRVIAATNQDLDKKVELGEFRKDLYYRLKVMELSLPHLRERKEDIPLLINYFLVRFNKKLNKKIVSVSDDVKKAFMDYSWPGNIRELEHTLEHAFVTAKQDIITVDHLPKSFIDSYNNKYPVIKQDNELDEISLLKALQKTGWNKSKAARLLGVNVRTVYRKIRKYNIKEETDSI